MSGSAFELVRRHKSGETTATETVRATLDRLEEWYARIGAVAAIDRERSLVEAARADRRLRAGRGRILEGVPMTVKDWIDVAGWPVTGATGTLPGSPGRRPAVDATAVARLRAAGAIVVAISAAMADNRLYGVTRNPAAPDRAPGGSSTGTAALVAAGAVPLGLGSDSGGSIRLPAAWCGIAGLKPTFGRVPLTGHFPRCGALEDGRTVIGPLAGGVRDLITALAVIAGPDGLDAGVAPVPLGDPATVNLRGLRVGTMAGDLTEPPRPHPATLPRGGSSHAATPSAASGFGVARQGVPGAAASARVSETGEGAQDAVVTAAAEPVAAAVRALVAAGAVVVAEPVPDLREEALELTRRHWGRAALSGAEHARVLWDWDRFRRRVLAATAHLDLLVIPAAPTPPPPWRESEEADYLWTLPWSLTGAPAVVVPAGTQAGRAGAVQLVARPWEDHVALAAALCVQAATVAASQKP
ncbi:amidase [Nonomuraea fuscirosea]|uniref:amidase n=1 Tax=Nonomuraea fuscirosea TaxID=1291556 RepID=UPI00343F9C6E